MHRFWYGVPFGVRVRDWARNSSSSQPCATPMRSGCPIVIASYAGTPTSESRMSMRLSSSRLPIGSFVLMQHGYTAPSGSTDTSEPLN